jgi:hypothetical protein
MRWAEDPGLEKTAQREIGATQHQITHQASRQKNAETETLRFLEDVPNARQRFARKTPSVRALRGVRLKIARPAAQFSQINRPQLALDNVATPVEQRRERQTALRIAQLSTQLSALQLEK